VEASPEYAALARKACDVAIHEVLSRLNFESPVNAQVYNPRESHDPRGEQMRLLIERRQGYASEAADVIASEARIAEIGTLANPVIGEDEVF